MNTGTALLVWLGQGLCCFVIPAVIATLLITGKVIVRSPFKVNNVSPDQERLAVRTIVQRQQANKPPEDRIGIGRPQ